jgi:proteic killer suppression protein
LNQQIVYPLAFNAGRYIVIFMIQSYKCKETEKIFHRQYSKNIPNDIQRPALRKLRMLNRASALRDLAVPPGNRLEPLHGNRKGQHSIHLMTSGEFALNGITMMPMMSKLSITTRS